jgi:hypothetical protein
LIPWFASKVSSALSPFTFLLFEIFTYLLVAIQASNQGKLIHLLFTCDTINTEKSLLKKLHQDCGQSFEPEY